MAITVRNVLELPSLKEFRLAAGGKGLDNPVEKTGIVDHEFADGGSPSAQDAFEKNSFVISTLLFAKDRPEWISGALRTLHAYGVSALAVKTVFYQELPEEVLRYADEAEIPVFLFDHAYFEDIIGELQEALKEDLQCRRERRLLDEMIRGVHSPEMVKRLALEINPSLKQWTQAFFCSGGRPWDDWQAHRALHFLQGHKEWQQETAAFRYENGFLFLISGEGKKDKNRFEISLRHILRTAGLDLHGQGLAVGCGKIRPLQELDRSIKEAVGAFKGAVLLKKESLEYERMGVLRLLLEMDPEILSECACDFTAPLDKGSRKGAELWETARIYVRTGGDMEKVSSLLCLHPNTVRYRLAKLREKLDRGEGEQLFFQNLYMAVWAEQILKEEEDGVI